MKPKTTKPHTLDDLRLAREAVYEAEQREVEVMKSAIPAGATVYYSHGSNSIKATVDDHGELSARVWVIGASGKRYQICASSVLSVLTNPTKANKGSSS